MLLAALAALATLSSCRLGETALHVDTRARVLTLCHAGQALGWHPVGLGTGGLGKTREGDARTPLGLYPLGRPRASQRFGIFVPVGYPTAAQRQRGFTGGAVGVHGPPRGASAAGWGDWTLGCIALATDAEIGAVASFVRRYRVQLIRLD